MASEELMKKAEAHWQGLVDDKACCTEHAVKAAFIAGYQACQISVSEELKNRLHKQAKESAKTRLGFRDYTDPDLYAQFMMGAQAGYEACRKDAADLVRNWVVTAFQDDGDVKLRVGKAMAEMIEQLGKEPHDERE